MVVISHRSRHALVMALGLAVASSAPLAQSADRRFEAAAHVAVATTSQFEGTEVGVGGRFAWKPISLVGFEVELTHYPGDYPDGFPISRARWEGLFGGTVGPHFGRVRPFARVRPGFLSYREAPAPFACIAIYPPPLVCTLGAGRTVLAVDIGGGVEAALSDRSFVRIDLGNRAVRYDGPVFDFNRRQSVDSFWSHGFRVTAGGGLRF